jgi:hypothetical protein
MPQPSSAFDTTGSPWAQHTRISVPGAPVNQSDLLHDPLVPAGGRVWTDYDPQAIVEELGQTAELSER